VYRALTTEPGAGDVGQWFGPGSSTSPVLQLFCFFVFFFLLYPFLSYLE
jgi:hypothetical protein